MELPSAGCPGHRRTCRRARPTPLPLPLPLPPTQMCRLVCSLFMQSSSPTQQQEPGACFKQVPGIQPALEQFDAPAWAAATASTQSSEEALAALRGVMWGK